MEFYPRGNWIVGTPIWVFKEQDIVDKMAKMVCPHLQWTEAERQTELNPEDGITYLVVKDQCGECGAIRMRLIPTSLPEEPFDYSTPMAGPWYERLYDLGSLFVLIRRYQNNPDVPPSFMTRALTKSGNVHVGMVQLETLLFSPAGYEMMRDMEKVAKLGPKKYADLRILKEGRSRKREKQEIKEHADSLFSVAQEIGPESIAAAKSVFEAEIESESAEAEEYEIQAMEEEVKQRKAALKRKPK